MAHCAGERQSGTPKWCKIRPALEGSVPSSQGIKKYANSQIAHWSVAGGASFLAGLVPEARTPSSDALLVVANTRGFTSAGDTCTETRALEAPRRWWLRAGRCNDVGEGV